MGIELRIVRVDDPPSDDRVLQALRGRDHPRVVLRKAETLIPRCSSSWPICPALQGSKARKQNRYWSSLMLAGVPGTLIFGCGSVVPLIILQSADGALPGLFDIDIYRAVWWLGVALTVIYALLAMSAQGLGRPLSETLTGHGRPRQPTDSTGEPDPAA